MTPDAFFLPTQGPQGEGQRFCLFHPAAGAARAAVLYVPPFAEEMNKSRRMAALQARALAASGCDVLQIDLLGCGDSSGDFGDAGWDDWLADIARGIAWLQQRSTAPLWLWGLRTGCLLAAEAARRLPVPCHLLFWHPVGSGKAALQQFLRLKLASELQGGQAKALMEGLRGQLAAGAAVEIAGYALSPALAQGLERASLASPPAPRGAARLEWLELSMQDDAELLPASLNSLAAWQQAGWHTRSHLVRGPAFWQTTEIEVAPALVGATVEALSALAEAVAS